MVFALWSDSEGKVRDADWISAQENARGHFVSGRYALPAGAAWKMSEIMAQEAAGEPMAKAVGQIGNRLVGMVAERFFGRAKAAP